MASTSTVTLCGQYKQCEFAFHCQPWISTVRGIVPADMGITTFRRCYKSCSENGCCKCMPCTQSACCLDLQCNLGDLRMSRPDNICRQNNCSGGDHPSRGQAWQQGTCFAGRLGSIQGLPSTMSHGMVKAPHGVDFSLLHALLALPCTTAQVLPARAKSASLLTVAQC